MPALAQCAAPCHPNEAAGEPLKPGPQVLPKEVAKPASESSFAISSLQVVESLYQRIFVYSFVDFVGMGTEVRDYSIWLVSDD